MLTVKNRNQVAERSKDKRNSLTSGKSETLTHRAITIGDALTSYQQSQQKENLSKILKESK